MSEEFRRLGRCPTCGQHRIEEAMCGCGHSVSSHSLGKKAGKTVRTYCSNYRCECRHYSPVDSPLSERATTKE